MACGLDSALSLQLHGIRCAKVLLHMRTKSRTNLDLSAATAWHYMCQGVASYANKKQDVDLIAATAWHYMCQVNDPVAPQHIPDCSRNNNDYHIVL